MILIVCSRHGDKLSASQHHLSIWRPAMQQRASSVSAIPIHLYRSAIERKRAPFMTLRLDLAYFTPNAFEAGVSSPALSFGAA
jgi:hypothetical protein